MPAIPSKAQGLTNGRKAVPELLISQLEEMKLGDDDFDPVKHLAFKPPSKVHSMKDIGLPEGTGVSPVAVSEPFSLFTAEAVQRMRTEVLRPEVLQNCQYSSDLAQCQLRGFAAQSVAKLSLYAL